MSSMILVEPLSHVPFLSVSFAPFLLPHPPSLWFLLPQLLCACLFFWSTSSLQTFTMSQAWATQWVNKIGPVSALMGLPDQCRDIGDEQQPEGNGVWGRKTTVDGQQGRLLCRGDSKSEGIMPPPPWGPRKPSLTFLT